MELRAVEDQVAQVVVAEQSRAFVAIVTDGLVRWDGPLSRLSTALDGVEPGPLRRWFSTNLLDRRPRVTGPVGRREPILVREFLCANEVGPKALKMVLPGPVTFARLAVDEHYGRVEALAREVGAALAEEAADLAAAGCSIFHLDEPILCVHPEDLALVVETAGEIFRAAGEGATTILSTSHGDLAGSASLLSHLPGTHVGLDLVEGERNWDLLPTLPAGRGVALGLFDAASTAIEDAAEVFARLAPHRDALMARDVIVGPNAGLETLPRDPAFEKLLHARYLVEKAVKEWGWRS